MKQPSQRFVLPRVHEGEGLAEHMEHYSKEPVTLIEHIFPGDTNDHDTLFGGRLLSIMDKAGGIACSKFAHREFVTISIDTLKFIAPCPAGRLVGSDRKSCVHQHIQLVPKSLRWRLIRRPEEKENLRRLLFLCCHRFDDAANPNPTT